MSNWTKGGRWNRATIYRYGGDIGQYCHLCFYSVRGMDWEFEVTQIIDNPDMVCMLYPFVDKVALLDQLDAWVNHPDVRPEAKWECSVSRDDKVEVRFYE